MEKVRTRYFYICTIGQKDGGRIVVNHFSIQTEDFHPTIKECVEASGKYFPEVLNTTLVSIMEISAKDWEHFISDK